MVLPNGSDVGDACARPEDMHTNVLPRGGHALHRVSVTSQRVRRRGQLPAHPRSKQQAPIQLIYAITNGWGPLKEVLAQLDGASVVEGDGRLNVCQESEPWRHCRGKSDACGPLWEQVWCE